MPVQAFKRQLRISYFVPFAAMALLAAVVVWRVSAQSAISDWIEHSNEVLLSAKDAQIEFSNMRLALRGYLAFSDNTYLGELNKASDAFDRELETIAALVADNPEQERRLIRVAKVYLPDRFEQLAKEHQEGSLKPGQITESNAYSKQVLAGLDRLIAVEYRLRAQRTHYQRILDRTIVALTVVLSGLIAGLLTYQGWRQINQATDRFAAALTRAEEANRAKDNFLATVSHELRNPLNSIILLAGMMLADPESSQTTRQRVKGIERAARTQAQMIEDLLDIARIESGRLRLDVQATDLSQVVKTAVESMRTAAEAKAIDLHDIIDTRIGLIAGDPRRLEQVVWNLISNAIKFTPKGGKIQVRLERINSHVEIVVTDNGQGIAPSSLPYIFQRFWQESASGQDNLGIGLGLSIVRELVALHGGTVTAHSEGIGRGSTFTVRLPLPPATAPLLEPRRHPTVSPSGDVTAAPRLDGLSIVVVDDEAEACEALKNLLGSLGASVVAETSVKDAIQRIRRSRPDAIISDIEIPVDDGFVLAKQVRILEQERKSGRHIPLIALTAYGRVEDKVRILAGGFDSHVVKPVDLAELSATIRSLVAAHAA